MVGGGRRLFDFEEALIRGWALNRINTVIQSAKL